MVLFSESNIYSANKQHSLIPEQMTLMSRFFLENQNIQCEQSESQINESNQLVKSVSSPTSSHNNELLKIHSFSHIRRIFYLFITEILT